MLSACLSLLAVQLSGLHMHMDAEGNVGDPQGLHLHSQPLHSHEGAMHVHTPDVVEHEHPGENGHDGDKDIAIAEMSAGKTQLSVLGIYYDVGLLVTRAPTGELSPVADVPLPSVRNSRWRPPLRAPPQFS